MKKFFIEKYKKTEIFDDFYKLLGNDVKMIWNKLNLKIYLETIITLN